MSTAYYKSPVGLLEITEKDKHIASLEIIDDKPKVEGTTSPLLEKAVKQLDEYFAGKRSVFDLPLKQEGTEFQQKAWKYIQSIPYGKTVSYKEEAIAVGSPKAYRAVGSANGCNAIPIIIPCHRIINSNGKLGGFAYDISIKEQLLRLEKEHSQK